MRSCLLLTIAALTAASLPARAEMKVIAEAGSWQAFGGAAAGGKPACGVSTTGGGKWMGVKYFKGDDTLTVQLSNTAWTVTDNDQIAVTMAFDAEMPWKARATAFHMPDKDAALEFAINADQIGTFMDEFRKSDTLVVGFPNDTVKDWQADLSGTNAVASGMIDCVREMLAE